MYKELTWHVGLLYKNLKNSISDVEVVKVVNRQESTVH